MDNFKQNTKKEKWLATMSYDEGTKWIGKKSTN